MLYRMSLFLLFSAAILVPVQAQSPDSTGCAALPPETLCKAFGDFESETVGEPPEGWQTSHDRELYWLTAPGAMTPRQNVYVRREDGNQFARVHTEDRAFRVVLFRKNGLDWSLDRRPYLRWSWRAKALPEGANENDGDKNDTGGALYVTFDRNWLGRPRSIKYTYSSTLPVGTTVDYGLLQVLVVASQADQGLDQWVHHERNVIKDYRRLFGDTPDKTPRAIMMWSDSNTMDSVGTTDFDNILVLGRPSAPSQTVQNPE